MARQGVAQSTRDFCRQIGKHPFQFFLAIFLVMCCGATKKFQLFPMPWIAGQSKCQKIVTEAPTPESAEVIGVGEGKKLRTYTPATWLQTTPDCEEKAQVFLFVSESFTITTAYLVFFGLTKAVFNFITGVCCDRIGRKWTLVAGWIVAIPIPFMVVYAQSWWSVATSNIFLGMQQALVWSATIFIMIDYAGRSNAGVAVGINETVGYTTIAIVNVIAAQILDESNPRAECYFVVKGLIVVGILVGALLLKESKPEAVKEEADMVGDQSRTAQDTATITWPSGREVTFSKARSAFVYTSFVSGPLMTICFAGLMINFISGFAWGLFVKWMKNDYTTTDGDLLWGKLPKETIAGILLCYGLPKGLLQWIFGFAGDRVGRRWIITCGLTICVVGLLVIAGSGETQSDPVAGFFVGALLVGFGTAVIYSNLLAAIVDHADPTWRSSALGAYRFWRDLGYAIGALVQGLFADGVGIFGSVLLTAALTGLAATCVGIFYREGTAVEATEGPKAEKASSESEGAKELGEPQASDSAATGAHV